MTKDKALKLALEALETCGGYPEKDFDVVKVDSALAAIKEALAQPEPKCVACEGRPSGGNDPCSVCGLAGNIASRN